MTLFYSLYPLQFLFINAHDPILVLIGKIAIVACKGVGDVDGGGAHHGM